MEGEEDDEEEEEEIPDEWKELDPESRARVIIYTSCKQMFLGTCVVLIFSDPMVDILNQVGNVTGINPFYISFVLAPVASNAPEILASIN